MLGAILGFLGPWVPDIIGIFRDIGDRRHEMALFELRLRHADAEADRRAWETGLTAGTSDRRSARAYQPALSIRLLDAARRWKLMPQWLLGTLVFLFGIVDFLSQTVRPVVTYLVVGLWFYLLVDSIREVVGGETLWAAMQGAGNNFVMGLLSAVVPSQGETLVAVLDAFFFGDVVLSVIFFWFGQRTRTRVAEGR